MADKDQTVNFNVPKSVIDFVFDLHEASRKSLRVEDVRRLYEQQYRETTDKFYNNSYWPEAKAISNEVRGDEFFLALYTEMSIRHITTKLKPTLNHHLSSWANYKKLFEYISNAKNNEICLSTQWIYDITQEFAYQFQGFCQFRFQQASNHNNENIKTLQQHPDVWTLPEVMSMLNKLIKAGSQATARDGSSSLELNDGNVLQQFAYFATIEVGRLECLLGDYSSALTTLSSFKLDDRNELFTNLPICYFNVFYHIGVSNMMLHRFFDAMDVFGEIILHVLRSLKPGATTANRGSALNNLPRMMDKALSLLALLLAVNPQYRVEDEVKEVAETKFGDKIRRVQAGDEATALDLFESSCPKFISPLVPDYTATVPSYLAVFNRQSSLIVGEIMSHVPFLSLRSLLSMYSSIDLAKLARFLELSEADVVSLLFSYKSKTSQQSAARSESSKGGSTYDLKFHVEGGVVVSESTNIRADQMAVQERFFIHGAQKNVDTRLQLLKTFSNLGL